MIVSTVTSFTPLAALSKANLMPLLNHTILILLWGFARDSSTWPADKLDSGHTTFLLSLSSLSALSMIASSMKATKSDVLLAPISRPGSLPILLSTKYGELLILPFDHRTLSLSSIQHVVPLFFSSGCSKRWLRRIGSSITVQLRVGPYFAHFLSASTDGIRKKAPYASAYSRSTWPCWSRSPRQLSARC